MVVVAGVITTWIAVATSDGVVADDYYKRGLGINRDIARDARAQSLGVAARVTFNEERDAVRVTLATTQASPAALRLTLVHPTRGGGDREVELRRVAPGMFEGKLEAVRAGSWQVTLEDAERTWRVARRWSGLEASVMLGTVD